MKRMAREMQLYLDRRAVRIAKARRTKHRRHSPRTRSFQLADHTIKAPDSFILHGNQGWQTNQCIENFFSFISKIRNYRGHSVCIDLSSTRRMIADATLLFKAELSRLIQHGGVTVSAIAPRSTRIQQVIKQTGLDKLLALTITSQPHREDVVHWKVAEGPQNQVDPDALEPIMTDIEAVTGITPHPIYQGIIESMSNCVEHAYKAHPEVKRFLPMSPGWWVFQQVKDATLSVMVCDLGIGINRALPLTLSKEPGLLKKLLHLARRAKGVDNRALLAAMEYGRSSTGEHQRGKGMRNAHAVVDEVGSGELVAISNAGCYVYTRKSKTESSTRTMRLKGSINGTILRWRLPLKPVTEV